jgi:hypothetical protein
MVTRDKVLLLVSLLAILFPSPVLTAQESHARIVRISYFEGDVRLNNQDVSMNVPLTENGVLVTGNDGVAEVEFEDGSRLRVAPESQITFSQLARLSSGEALTRVDLDEGEIELTVRRGAAAEYAISVHRKNIQVAAGTRVRVLSVGSDPLEVAVWAGKTVVHDSETGQDVVVKRDETLAVATNDPEQYDLEKGIEPDDLDQFCQSRDQYLASASAGGTSPQAGVTGSVLVDPCTDGYWVPGSSGNCFSSYYPGPIIEGVYVPGYYPRHPRHPHHPPHIHPPTPPVVAKEMPKSRGVVPDVKPVEPEKRSSRFFDDENFKRRTLDEEHENGLKESGRGVSESRDERAEHRDRVMQQPDYNHQSGIRSNDENPRHPARENSRETRQDVPHDNSRAVHVSGSEFTQSRSNNQAHTDMSHNMGSSPSTSSHISASPSYSAPSHSAPAASAPAPSASAAHSGGSSTSGGSTSSGSTGRPH